MKKKTTSFAQILFAGVVTIVAAVAITSLVGSSSRKKNDCYSYIELERMNIDELNEIMDKHVKTENYEKAAAIRDLINKKKSLIF